MIARRQGPQDPGGSRAVSRDERLLQVPDQPSPLVHDGGRTVLIGTNEASRAIDGLPCADPHRDVGEVAVEILVQPAFRPLR
ncbi:hypothetical protein [Labrys sp. 22185]|uniref:hypothetical protein n=1 Tax=Labrys sp. 22185 TaxID=3453888 RepID=UPI003F84EC42